MNLWRCDFRVPSKLSALDEDGLWPSEYRISDGFVRPLQRLTLMSALRLVGILFDRATIMVEIMVKFCKAVKRTLGFYPCGITSATDLSVGHWANGMTDATIPPLAVNANYQ